MGFPLNNVFRPGEPIANIQAAWLKTVANIFNDIQGIGCHIEKPPGGEGLGWQIIVDSSELNNGPLRFQLIDQLDGTSFVYLGAWSRRGKKVSITLDLDKGYQTITSYGTEDYIYLELEREFVLLTNADEDPALAPFKVTIKSSITDPEPGDTNNVIRVIGKFTGSVWKQFWTGDIDDFAIIPDSDSAFDVTNPPEAFIDRKYNSLQYADRGGLHRQTLQLFDWDTHPDVTPTLADVLLWQDDDVNKTLKYGTLQGVQDLFASNIVDIDFINEIISIIDATPGLGATWSAIIQHHEIDSITGSTTGDFADGGGELCEDHDPRYLRYSGATVPEDKTFHTTGEIHANVLAYVVDPVNNRWGDDGGGGTEFRASVERVTTTATGGSGLDDLVLQTTDAGSQVTFDFAGELKVSGKIAIDGETVRLTRVGPGGPVECVINNGILCTP